MTICSRLQVRGPRVIISSGCDLIAETTCPSPSPTARGPFIDVGRAQRLKLRADGKVEIWANPNNTIRVDGGPDPWLADPHTPLRSDAKSAIRYKLAAKDFGYVFESRMLFGGASKDELFTRPRIMDLTSYKLARVCALGTDEARREGIGKHSIGPRGAKACFPWMNRRQKIGRADCQRP